MIQNPSGITFTDCLFQHNKCTAIAAVHSDIIFKGDTKILDNTSLYGAGLVMCDRSFIFMKPETTITIANNHALQFGGGIYAEDQCLQSQPACFFQVISNITRNPELVDTVHVELINNTTGFGGSAVYGGSVDICYSLQNSVVRHHLSGQQIFNRVFEIEYFPNDYSPISSDPIGICFCSDHSNKRDCTLTSPEVFIFPGETFRVSAVVVGQRSGNVPGVVLATFNGTRASLANSQSSQSLSTMCMKLNYTVFSHQSLETLVLSVQQSGFNKAVQYRRHSLSIKIALKPCPIGFTLQHDPAFCDCSMVLLNHGITCDIPRRTIRRPSPN